MMTMTSATTMPKVTGSSTMQEVIDAYPSAQRALFRRYHIGGCQSCGYQPEETLVAVTQRHGIEDLDEVLRFIEEAEQSDRRMQMSVQEVAGAVASATPPRLLDVRTPQEWELARIEGARLVDEKLAQEMMRWPKDTPIVFVCHVGDRSLDAAAYFAGHGFRNARSMTGGIDAWSREVDPSVPQYEVAFDPFRGGAVLRPLRSVVSQATGCQK
jgi:rhodanese-related sulfurtransferase